VLLVHGVSSVIGFGGPLVERCDFEARTPNPSLIRKGFESLAKGVIS
jgi:hypothetical protein